MSFPGYDDKTRKTAAEMGPDVHGAKTGGGISHLMCTDKEGHYWPRADISGALEEVNRYYLMHYGMHDAFKNARMPDDAKGENYYAQSADTTS